jgi:hypothetical protein
MWKPEDAGTAAAVYNLDSLSLIYIYRNALSSAIQRRSFPNGVIEDKNDEILMVYTLATIIYRENLGQEDWQDDAPVTAISLLDFSIGVAQISFSTARKLEELGLLTDPCSSSKDKIDLTRFGTNKKDTVDRLIDPVWAIELGLSLTCLPKQEYAGDGVQRANSR